MSNKTIWTKDGLLRSIGRQRVMALCGQSNQIEEILSIGLCVLYIKANNGEINLEEMTEEDVEQVLKQGIVDVARGAMAKGVEQVDITTQEDILPR